MADKNKLELVIEIDPSKANAAIKGIIFVDNHRSMLAGVFPPLLIGGL